MSENTRTDNDCFEVGGVNLLLSASNDSQTVGSNGEEAVVIGLDAGILEDIRLQIGTLLKTETVSLLLGAGASVDCGGQLIGSIPLELERALHSQGIAGMQPPRLRRWLLTFYLAVRYAGGAEDTPVTRSAILDRRDEIDADRAELLDVNLESVLATLHRWRLALSETGDQLKIDGTLRVNVSSTELDQCIGQATAALACACNLPTDDKKNGCEAYRSLVRKLLTRPLNLKRINIFTLNYDTLVEQAADSAGVVLLDGFVGTQSRVFRPESYEQDLYFPTETTEGRVHRFSRVMHLYKLHGSITWTANQPSLDNPYGASISTFDPKQKEPLLIYPMPAKYGEILGLPYSELFRRFANTIARPQSVLLALGYGFGDEHVNAIIRQALSVPSFTLVIVDPAPDSQFVKTLRELKDRRVWVVAGPNLGTFNGFVRHVLPDLQDEEIQKKVLKTQRALAKIPSHE